MWCRVKKWGEKSLIIIIIAMVTLAVGAIFYRAISVIVVFYEIGKEDLIRGDALNFISILVAISVAVGGWLVTYKYRQDEKVARYTDWIIAAFVFFALLWTGLQLDWKGNTANVTDVLSFVAIIIAAGTAVYGWRRADRIARDARELADRLAKEERQRIAMADATILYHKLRPISEETIMLLLDLTTPADQGLALLFSSLEEIAKKNPVAPSKVYEILEKISTDSIRRFPDTTGYYEAIRSLYVAERIFGGHVVKVLSHIDALKTDLSYYNYQTLDHRLENFRQRPAIEIELFFDFLANTTAVLAGVEILRRMLKDIPFNPGPTNALLLDLEKQLRIVCGIEGAEVSDKIGPDEYFHMLSTATKSFEEKGSNGSKSASSELKWNERFPEVD